MAKVKMEMRCEKCGKHNQKTRKCLIKAGVFLTQKPYVDAEENTACILMVRKWDRKYG